MKLTGVIHREGGIVWFDDVPVTGPEDIPRRKAWRGAVFYASPSVRGSDLAKLMGPEDVAFGGSPGKLLGLRVRINGGGSYKILASSTWGVGARGPDECFTQIRDLMLDAASSDLQVCSSVARTAIKGYLDRYDGKGAVPRMTKLPCRWRGMAHAALHGGPLIVTRASASKAAHIDLRSAYLDALFQPMPVHGKVGDHNVGGWYSWDESRWERISKYDGFVDATVWVDPAVVEKWGIPPLPMHLYTGSVFATGLIRGCWTIDLVKEAVERGEVEVREVHQFCVAPAMAPIFEGIAADFMDMPRSLSKRLYTRFWGRFASRGGWEARRRIELEEGEVPSLGLAWKWDGIDLLSYQGPSTYRPDLAAFVAAHNHRKVLKAVRSLKPGSVIASHVDALWTSDLEGASSLCTDSDQVGSWKYVREGPLRFYGTGAYHHGPDVAASGYDPSVLGPLTPASLRGWAASSRNERKLLLQTRRWDSDPATDPDAKSRPLHLDLSKHHIPVDAPAVLSSHWTRSGWFRREDPPTQADQTG